MCCFFFLSFSSLSAFITLSPVCVCRVRFSATLSYWTFWKGQTSTKPRSLRRWWVLSLYDNTVACIYWHQQQPDFDQAIESKWTDFHCLVHPGVGGSDRGIFSSEPGQPAVSETRYEELVWLRSPVPRYHWPNHLTEHHLKKWTSCCLSFSF